jgi:hypothetical protein
VDALDALRHFRLVGRRQEKGITRRDAFERRVGSQLQNRRPKALVEKLARKKEK